MQLLYVSIVMPDAGHYFAGHPKGSKFSPTELLRHKGEWF
jgi:hypothetical protein